MEDNNRRHRISRLVEYEVVRYLKAESDWQPSLGLSRTSDSDVIIVEYPEMARLPNYEITVKEVPYDRC